MPTKDMSNPEKDGTYLVRDYWRNPMTGRVFDRWRMMEYKSGMWITFSGNKIIEWRELP